jgi:P pilus assembly chaperone PapD
MPALRQLTLWSVVFLLSWISVSQAMTVSPMQVEMISIGTRSHARVSVVNNSKYPMPVEAVIAKLTLDETGKQKSTKAGDDFLIMPPQAMIQPGATQNFRIQWLGDPALARSESFMLYVNQIPVKQPQGKSGLQFVMSMGVMINVAPATGAPQLKVVSTGVTTGKDGKRYPSITVENPSNTHALLPRATVHLASGNWSSTLKPNDIADRLGIGLVQPGRRRKFTLPVELPSTVARIDASVEMTKQ